MERKSNMIIDGEVEAFLTIRNFDVSDAQLIKSESEKLKFLTTSINIKILGARRPPSSWSWTRRKEHRGGTLLKGAPYPS